VYLTGFADEASPGLDGQIKATLDLGWSNIESRNIDGVNIHNLPEDKFDEACEKLAAAGVSVNCFGSAVANWAKKITEPFDSSLEEASRAIPRMQRLGTKLIRVMSFAVIPDADPEDQMADERFRRLNELQKMFADAGLQMVHENCMNYGGMGWKYTLKLVENVPGLKLVFDTGNPTFTLDRAKPKPYPRQSAWEFYTHVKEHIAYIHIKDARWDEAAGKEVYTYAGEGEGDVKRILTDLISSGYDGGISIEPHLAAVFHDSSIKPDEAQMYSSYVEYGRRVQKMVDDICGK